MSKTSRPKNQVLLRVIDLMYCEQLKKGVVIQGYVSGSNPKEVKNLSRRWIELKHKEYDSERGGICGGGFRLAYFDEIPDEVWCKLLCEAEDIRKVIKKVDERALPTAPSKDWLTKLDSVTMRM